MKGENAMSIQTQAHKFAATILQNLPEVSEDIIQGWIENPSALQKALRSVFLPPQSGIVPQFWNEKVWQIDTTPRGEKKRESNKFFDSGNKLSPLRVCMYTRERDVCLDFLFSDKRDVGKSFEFIINNETHSIISPKPDPMGEEAFAEVLVDYDILAKIEKYILIFRLERC